MHVFKLADMVGGWFVGNFTPSALRTDAAEVAVQRYRAGDRDPAHVHKIAAELTLILSGEVEMNGRRLTSGDIVALAAGEPAEFRALTETTTVVVKLPSVPGDKHAIESAR